MSKELLIPEVLTLVAELAFKLGVQNIKDLPGCWEHQVDDSWWIAVNGHHEAIRCSDNSETGMAAEVPPYHVYVTYHGWAAGIVGPAGGIIVGGDGANENRLCAALRAAISHDVAAQQQGALW